MEFASAAESRSAKNGSGIFAGFCAAARRYPENPVFRYYREDARGITYSELLRKVGFLAAYLSQLGFRPGDKAAIFSENRPEWGLAYLAATAAGGIVVPLDSQYGSRELSVLLADSEAGLIFCSSGTIRTVQAAADVSGSSSRIMAIDFDSHEFESISEAAGDPGFNETSFGEVASIIYTSGTTGNPKGVMLTHGNFLSDADAVISAGIVSHEDNVLSILPLHHTYAFMCTFLVPVLLGASITYPRSLKGPEMLAAIREQGVTIMIGVPQVFQLLRNGIIKRFEDMPFPLPFLMPVLMRAAGTLRDKYGINAGRVFFRRVQASLGKRFRFFGSGGAKLDPDVARDLEALGFTLLEGYGLTETAPVLTFNPISKNKRGSAGMPLPSVEMKIVDPSPSGEGEIAVRGPMLMKGYYKNPAATEAVIKDGWFLTGDVGRIDEEGYLFITGRSKEIIVLGSGKNIYPEEVEKLYSASPLIREICVHEAPGAGAAEVLRAVIVPDLEYAKKEHISNITDALKWEINGISSSLPSYMRIQGFSVSSDPLPRTALGKLRRFLIKSGPPESLRTESPAAESEDQVVERTIAAVSEFIGGKPVSAGDYLELDLGLDSLSKLELTAMLEKTFSVMLPDDFISDVHTVGELAHKIKGSSEMLEPAEAGKAGWDEILLRKQTETAGTLTATSKKVPEFLVFSAFYLLKWLLILFFRLRAKDLGNLPKGGRFILAPNHTSYLDGFAVLLSLPYSYFKNTYSLGLKEFFTGPLKGLFADAANVIPIDSSSYLGKALQVSALVLRNDKSLCVFPEGGRSFDGKLLEFKKGVGILAVEMDVPVVPVYIDGALKALPKGSFLPRPEKIVVRFGKPLRASEITGRLKSGGSDIHQAFADEVRSAIMKMQQESS